MGVGPVITRQHIQTCDESDKANFIGLKGLGILDNFLVSLFLG